MSVGSVRGAAGGAGVLAAVVGGVTAAYGAVTATRGRSVVAAVTAGSLVAGTAWAVVERDEIVAALSGEADRCAVDSARTEAEAFELAVLCEKNIEIESLRTEFDTSWATPRETILADSSAGAVRTAVHGAWEPVDTTVTIDGSGVPEVAAPVFDLGLTAGDRAGGEAAGFAVIGRDEQSLSMSLPEALGLGTPVIDADEPARVVYPVLGADDVPVAGADLLVTVHPDGTGFTPVLRITDSAAADALIAEVGDGGLGFDVEVGDGLTLTEDEPVDPDAAPDPEPVDGGAPDGAWEQDTGDPDADAGGTAATGTASTSSAKQGAARATTEGDATASATDAATSTQTSTDPGEEGGGFYAVDSSGAASFTGAVGLQWDSTSATTAEGETSPRQSTSSLSTLDSTAPDEAGPAEPGRSAGNAADDRGRGQASPTAIASSDPANAPSSSQDPVREAQPGDRVAMLPARVASDGRSAAVRADQAMLDDPATAFPVYVDPSVSGSRTSWTAIKKAWPSSSSSWKFSGSAGVGFCDVYKDGYCERTGNVWRSIWKFTGLKKVGGLKSGDIVDAKFRAYGTHSYSCTATATELYRVPNITSSTNWSNHAGSWDSSRKVSSKNTAYYSSACGGDHWTEWPATSVAKTIASNGWSSVVLGLKGTSTTDMNSWKKYRYDARFQVEYNRAPAMPSGHRTIVDGSNIGCGTSGEPDYSNWLRPQLSAVGKDPDGQQVQMQFRVLTAGTDTQVWQSAWTGWKDPGSGGVRFTDRVDTGSELTSGKKYWWQARIKDKGGLVTGYSGSKHCYFVVDNTAPQPPKVTPLRDHPDAQAYYESDKERGGVGLTGCWELYAPSSDTTTLWWGYATRTNLTQVSLNSSRTTQVCATPAATGEKFLYVKVADAAGHSASTDYRFDVASAREDGVWTFDDPEARGADTSVLDPERDEFAPAGSLSTSTDLGFAPGPHAEFGAREGDEAMVARDSKIAWSDSPVIDTTDSFVVSAHVRLDEDTDPAGWYTALSQEAPLYNGFRLSYRPNTCPTADDTCWAFGVNREVDSNAITYAKSSVPVRFGEWVHLLGEYDKPAGQVRLYVCEIGTPDSPAVGEPKLAETAYAGDLPESSGRFVVGRGFVSGSPSNYWNGQIDNVRIFRGEVLAAAKIRRLCQGAEANQMVGGVDDVDPTVTGAPQAAGPRITDFDCDGLRDVAVADPEATVDGAAQAGAVHIAYGNGQTLRLTQATPGVAGGPEDGDGFGFSLATFDRNRDGCTDLAVGTPHEDLDGAADTGWVQIISGSPAGLAAGPAEVTYRQGQGEGSLAAALPEDGDVLGYAVAAGHTGAGTPWLALGAPGEDLGTTTDSGAIYYSLGLTSPKAVNQDSEGVTGSVEAGDRFGTALAGDSHYLAVGSPQEAIGSDDASGLVQVFEHVLDVDARPVQVTEMNQETEGLSGSSEAGDEFGAALDLTEYQPTGAEAPTDSLLVIGAPGESITHPTDGVDRDNAGRMVTIHLTAEATWSQIGGLSQASEGIPGDTETGDRFGTTAVIASTAPDSPTGDTMAVAIGVPGKTLNGYVGTGGVHVLSGTDSVRVPVTDQFWLVPGTAGLPGSDGTMQQLGQTLTATHEHLYVGMPDGPVSTGAAYAVPWANLTSGASQPVTTYEPGSGGIPAGGSAFGQVIR